MVQIPEHYEQDLLSFFDGKPEELVLYHEFFQCVDKLLPWASVKVQKSQISFYGRHLFAAASLPIRRRKGWPEHCLIVTFGLSRREVSPRIQMSVEPYPNRWTHHVLITEREQFDIQLMAWLQEAYRFSQQKR